MKTTHLFSGTAALLVLAGCQNTVNTVENADKTMTPNTITDVRFVTDGFLKDRLALKKIDISSTPDGFMRVQLEAVNLRVGAFAQAWSGLKGDNPYKIRYKFTWFTQDGMTADTLLSDWQDATVIPGETVYLQSVAPLKNCRDFKISLKEVKSTEEERDYERKSDFRRGRIHDAAFGMRNDDNRLRSFSDEDWHSAGGGRFQRGVP